MKKILYLLLTIYSMVFFITPTLAIGDTSIMKGSSINQYRDDLRYATTTAKHETPCAGDWSGTLTENNGSSHLISFAIDSTGIITSFNGLLGPVTGKMFSVNGQVSSFFRTGENSALNQFTIIGTLSNNTVNGIFIGDGTDGAAQFVRQ